MNIKFIKTDPRDTIEVTKLEYIDELENNRAYYLSLCGGELEWEVGRVVTFDEAFKGRSIHKTGEVYIWIVQHIFKIINIPYFDLVHLLKIHDLLNENDLKLLLIHTNNAVNRSNKNELIENKEKAKELKERINELLLLSENDSNNTSKADEIHSLPIDVKHKNIFDEMMKSDAPFVLLDELKESGTKIITEELYKIAKKYVFDEQDFLGNLLKNSKLKLKDVNRDKEFKAIEIRDYLQKKLTQLSDEKKDVNHYKIIDEAFTKFKEEIFKILNSEPIKLDTLEQDVRTFTVNAKDFISKYHKIALNDTSLMIDFTKQVNELSFIIEQLVKSTFDASYQNKTNKPQQWFGIHGINATTLLLEFNIFIDTLFIKDSTTSKEPQQETKTDAPTKKEYNSSQFNDHTYKLFCHIVDEYKKDGNIKFINIWYFLKRDIDKTKYKNILFNFTQTKYKEFVKKYDVEIKKFKKADFKYKDDEVGILQNITNDYYTSLKEIENT